MIEECLCSLLAKARRSAIVKLQQINDMTELVAKLKTQMDDINHLLAGERMKLNEIQNKIEDLQVQIEKGGTA